MNEVIRQLYQRKSVRRFKDKKIGKYEQELILNSAAMAPTAGNQQMYSIIRVSDENLKRKLSEKCDNQSFINDAPLVLVFVADFQKWRDIFNLAGTGKRDVALGDLFLALDDALIAAQNSVVAAYSLGISSCYIGDIMENCEDVRSLLNLPKYTFPACMVIYGYADEDKTGKKPKRSDMSLIVMENTYRRHTDKELMNLVSKGEEEFESYVRAFCRRKYDSNFSREMQRSVKKHIEIFTGIDK